ncbi:MAG: ribosome-binding factor [Phycisphaerales bacterium]|nr:ribosome-binding factor [Phycisphaerales bacterium]
MKDFANRGSRRRYGRAAAESESAEIFFGSQRGGRRDHKTAQLCRQVFQALSMALGDCGDDVLRGLLVHDVDPAPNAGRLLVRVGFSAVSEPIGVAEVVSRLEQASGFLRREVAAAITRKRAPELMFVLVAGGGEAPR